MGCVVSSAILGVDYRVQLLMVVVVIVVVCWMVVVLGDDGEVGVVDGCST